jgi:heme oxygenase (biliverdin-IX-beta and delta-forming)
MQVAGPPIEFVCVEEGRPGRLRYRLREATAATHHDLDAQFATFDLTARKGYRRFLEASAAALLPLEAALERTGVAGLFADWPERSRRDAITADLARLEGEIRPMAEIAPLSRNAVLGTMYVLEGSRLGARYLLRTIAASADPLIAEARGYLRHGTGQPLWRSFLARLEREPMTEDDAAEAIAGARQAFAMFAEAAARA